MSAIDLMTGDKKWVEYTVPTGSKGASIWSSPAADPAAGLIYGTTGNNYGRPATDTSDAFIAFNMETGAIVWKNQRVMNDTFGGGSFAGPDADFGANPVIYEAMVEGVLTKLVGCASKGGEAHAVRADNGNLVWTRPLCSGTADGSLGFFTNSTWTGKDLMVACNTALGATIYALEGGTGNTSWMRNVSGKVWGRTAAANGVGYVGVGATLEILDLETGNQIKSVPSKGGTVASTITVAHGRVAFGEGLSWGGGTRGTKLTVLKLP
jgi:outer membrane protein assembly factor BamB